MIIQEIRNTLSKKLLIFLIFFSILPYSIFFIQKNSYAFVNELDTFSFMFDGIIVIIFIFAIPFIYLGYFSTTLSNRFIVYQRVRMPLKDILVRSILTNILLTFFVFFTFVLHIFIFCFYIQPQLGLVQFYPEIHYLESTKEILQFDTKRYTFTQLLAYSPLIYGVFYSFWVGIMASLYSTLGFFSILSFKNKLIGISVPILVYIIGSFLSNLFEVLEPFGPVNAIFPFNSSQQQISIALLNLLFYSAINICLYIYFLKIKFHKLDNTL